MKFGIYCKMSFCPFTKEFKKNILAVYTLMLILVQKKSITQYF